MSENNKTHENNQLTIQDHGKSQFEDLIFQGLKYGGLHCTASKSHGKTRLLFSIAQALQQDPNVRVIAFDSSETWIYSASKIPVFNVSECDIIEAKRHTSQDFERYELRTANFVKIALDTEKDVLFRFKTRSPSRKGFFVRTVVNYLDAQQRAEKAKTENHENTKAICFIIEEASNIFNSRSTSSTECETFLSVFNEARNQKISFITASQRLNDFSKTIRAKQIQVLGKLSNEDITPTLRRIEKRRFFEFSSMKPQNWYFEESLIISPEFKQQGKPYIINQTIKQKWLDSLPKKKTLTEKLKDWLTVAQQFNPLLQKQAPSQTLEEMEKEDNKNESEDSEFDGEMMGFGSMFPEEF